jgi:hypothetical protein
VNHALNSCCLALRGLLLLSLLAHAHPVAAQEHSAANARRGTVPLFDFAPGVVPDTTEPRRYFPLEAGNTWEYLQTDGMIKRRYVEKDTVISDLSYFILNGQNFHSDGEPTEIITRRSTQV